MAKCCVPYCTSNSHKRSEQEGGEYVSFHEFPCDLTLQAQWLKVIARKDFVVNHNSNSSRVCSKHFREDDFIHAKNRRRLKKESVPSVFSDYPKYMQASATKPRKPPKRRLESSEKAETDLHKRTTPSITQNCISNNSIYFTDFTESVFPQILKFYPESKIESYSSDKVVLRMNLGDEEEAETFVKFYSLVTNTNWNVYRKVTSPERLVFSKLWACHHSRKNKKTGSKRNNSCKSSLKILIKKVNKNTKRNDSFLRLCPPLSTEVTIFLKHSHSTVSGKALRMLRVNDEVKEQFFDYFNDGKTPAEAILYHENKFLETEDLKNASVNPTPRQVYYMYDCWKVLNFGQTGGSCNHTKENFQLSSATPVIKAEIEDLETFPRQTGGSCNHTRENFQLSSATPVIKAEIEDLETFPRWTGTSCEYMENEIRVTNAPTVIKAESELYPLGSACPSISEETSSDMQWEESPQLSDTETLPGNSEKTVKFASAALKEELLRDWRRISKMILESNMEKDKANTLLNTLKSIKTVDDLMRLRVLKPSHRRC